MTAFKFSKMHGLGNDFVVIETITQHITLSPAMIRQIADRHYGIGCDQVLLVGKSSTKNADFSYTIFNSDGSQAGQCGNGARCVARFIHEHGLSDKKTLTLALNTQNISVDLINYENISVNMGVPQFAPAALPMNLPQNSTYALKFMDKEITFSAVSMGNPHCVIPVHAPLDSFPLTEWGTWFNHHPAFPQGVNVSLMRVDSRNQLSLRVFERGAGETLACGSAACAAMVCAYMLDLIDSPTTVCLPGGQLTIAWAGENHPVWMTGPATQVYEGIWSDESKLITR